MVKSIKEGIVVVCMFAGGRHFGSWWGGVDVTSGVVKDNGDSGGGGGAGGGAGDDELVGLEGIGPRGGEDFLVVGWWVIGVGGCVVGVGEVLCGMSCGGASGRCCLGSENGGLAVGGLDGDDGGNAVEVALAV